jgi:hypothetical protein
MRPAIHVQRFADEKPTRFSGGFSCNLMKGK